MADCPFCDPTENILLSDRYCYAMWTGDTGVPAGSAMVLPWAHRPTAFDLTAPEWTSHHALLAQLRELVATRHRPDGWNIGWNVQPVGGQSVPHAHCHLIPRYATEPLAGRGIRSWIKAPTNTPPTHAPPTP
jgi:histidine triad (HIT) family protein